MKHEFLYWMANETDSNWCNDSGITSEIEEAIKCGAIGCTTNPPLSYQALTEENHLYKDEIAKVPDTLHGDERVIEMIGIVVRNISRILMDMYQSSNGKNGYVRSQVQPSLLSDREAMLKMGKKISSWGKNVMVKIPGTAAGVWVVEELAALGIPTTPTVCPSVSQIVAMSEANERGRKRAIEKGITPAKSTAAVVMGRLQDYLSSLNDQRRAGLETRDLEQAVIAVAKRCYKLMKERNYHQILMPAAFRCVDQVTQLVGADLIMTIHPKIQKMVIEADEREKLARRIRIDEPVDEELLARVTKALPEFDLAYRENALEYHEFETYGATTMTLDGFDKTGWQKIKTLEKI